MRRRYTTRLYTERVAYIKRLIPHACIGADVIVGFPGESDKDFQQTMDYLMQLEVSYLHVFTYSERANTQAAEMHDQVPMNVRRQRNKRLRDLSRYKRRAFYQAHVGSTRPVLVERAAEKNHIYGFTDNYIKVNLSDISDLAEGVIPIKIGSIGQDESCQGVLVSDIESIDYYQ